MPRRLTEEELPEPMQKKLDEFRQSSHRLQSTVEEAKEEYPDLFDTISQSQREYNRLLDETKRMLKAHVEGMARDDPSIIESVFGEFTVTPRRDRRWDVEAFCNAADDLGIFEFCVAARILLETEEAHFNVAKARERGVLSNLITSGIVSLHIEYDVDGKKAEELLEGDQFRTLEGAAWKEELSNVACGGPKPSEPV